MTQLQFREAWRHQKSSSLTEMALPLGLRTIETLNVHTKVACLPLAVAKVLANLEEHHQSSPQPCLPELQKSRSGQ